MAEAVEARHRQRPPPRGAGRHRHRQDARLPGAGGAQPRPHRRRHRHQGAAGPAGRQGPAVPRRARRRGLHAGRSSRAARTTCAASGSHELLDDREGRLDVTTDDPGLVAVLQWAEETDIGDRAELAVEPRGPVWDAVSVGSDECPGAAKCPKGETCFAERARQRAAEADVIVVNTHLYGTHLAAGGVVLPPARPGGHRRGPPVRGGHLVHRRQRAHRRAGAAPRRTPSAGSSPTTSSSPTSSPSAPGSATSSTASSAPASTRRRRTLVDPAHPAPTQARRGRRRAPQGARRRRSTSSPAATAPSASSPGCSTTSPRPRVVPDRQRGLGRGARRHRPGCASRPSTSPRSWPSVLWDETTAVLCSATIPPEAPRPARHAGGQHRRHRRRAARSTTRPTPSSTAPPTSPTPRQDRADAVHDEIARARSTAAGGRTLALFTSWRAMQAAVEALRPRLDTEIIAQGELPKPALLERFTADPATSLFATMSFWEGVDVPGATLSCVVIDKLPFARPDDPLLEARREQVGRQAFELIDLPRAVTLLAQGAGRLIRTADRPGRRRRARPPPGHRQLPLGPRPGPAADAPHQGPGRGRSSSSHDALSRAIRGDTVASCAASPPWRSSPARSCSPATSSARSWRPGATPTTSRSRPSDWCSRPSSR